MTGGIQFVAPQNPGVYPANIAGNAANAVRSQEEALHKALVREFEIYCGVEQALKDIILEAVENNYLLEIEDEWSRPSGHLKESSKSKELAELRPQVLVVVIMSDACESKKKIN
jgi:hypothetical protein